MTDDSYDDEETLDLADTIRQLGMTGPAIPTGFPPLDKRLRGGGLAPGRIIAIGGPPGSFKTSLATMMLNAMSPFAPAVGLFADEGRAAAAVRLGQQLGYKREDLERGADELYPWIKKRMEGTFLLPDPDSPKACVTRCMQILANGVPNGNGAAPRLLVLDSVQTIPLTEDQEEDPDERMSISQLCYTSRQEILHRGWMGIFTSQSNYDSFRHKSEAKNSNPLAAFAGSRAIVYAADVCLAFGMPDDNDVVRVTIPKNRLGPKGNFVVKLDRERAMLIEVDASELLDQEDRDREAKAAERVRRAAGKILAKLAKRPGLTSTRLASETGTRKADVINALESLSSDGQITETAGPHGSTLYDLAP